MSYWYEPKLEDMEISEDEKDIDVLLGSDYSGNIWVSLKIQDIKELLKGRYEKEKKK